MERVEFSRYVSPEYARMEAEHLWPNVWQIACREEEVENPGDYFEYQILEHSILVTRTPSGEIKGYFNSCPHRGTQLAKGCGNLTQFTCPFHAWRWSLDGENRYVHDRADFVGLNDEDLRLPECQVGRWGGFVFVKLSDEGPSLEEFLSPIAGRLAPYKLDEYRIQSWRGTIAKTNWKITLEAFEESYHVVGTHPQFLYSIDDVGASYEVLGPHSFMGTPSAAPSERLGGDVDQEEIIESLMDAMTSVELADEAGREALEKFCKDALASGMSAREMFKSMGMARYGKIMPDLKGEPHYVENWNFTIFPNFVFNINPGMVFGILARPNGLDPDSCIFEVVSLQHPCGEDLPKAARRMIDDHNYDWGVVLAQDFSNFERIQQGMHQRSAKASRLASYQEMRMANRNTHIDKYYETIER
jgi:nitrite reductase/ring-hydroxylating ferredoxin subunit